MKNKMISALLATAMVASMMTVPAPVSYTHLFRSCRDPSRRRNGRWNTSLFWAEIR